MIQTKVCKGCNRKLELSSDNFFSNGSQPSGKKKWKPKCKACSREDRNSTYEEALVLQFGKLECTRCGYNNCVEALDCHHKDPSTKKFNIARFKASTRSLDNMLQELEKCVLLCANCHRELHAGIWSLK